MSKIANIVQDITMATADLDEAVAVPTGGLKTFVKVTQKLLRSNACFGVETAPHAKLIACVLLSLKSDGFEPYLVERGDTEGVTQFFFRGFRVHCELYPDEFTDESCTALKLSMDITLEEEGRNQPPEIQKAMAKAAKALDNKIRSMGGCGS